MCPLVFCDVVLWPVVRRSTIVACMRVWFYPRDAIGTPLVLCERMQHSTVCCTFICWFEKVAHGAHVQHDEQGARWNLPAHVTPVRTICQGRAGNIGKQSHAYASSQWLERGSVRYCKRLSPGHCLHGGRCAAAATAPPIINTPEREMGSIIHIKAVIAWPPFCRPAGMVAAFESSNVEPIDAICAPLVLVVRL